MSPNWSWRRVRKAECFIPKFKAHQYASGTGDIGAGCPSLKQENVSGTCAFMASAKKHARNVGEARYVSTITIVDFVNNAMEHHFVGMVCRNLDAACANKTLPVAAAAQDQQQRWAAPPPINRTNNKAERKHSFIG
jgi:hypothetical protein